VRKLFFALGAIAVGVGTSAISLASTVSTSSISKLASSTMASYAGRATTFTKMLSSPPGSAASLDMRAALRHGASKSSLHYVSTSVGSGLTTTITGDVKQTFGTQTIVVSYQGAKVSMVVELIGHEAYFRGGALAIEALINLNPDQAAAAAGQWVSVVPADTAYYESTAAALTVGSVISEIALSPPITGARNVVKGGRAVLEISGAWTGDGITAKEHATASLEVTKGSKSLPVEFAGVVPASSKTSRFVDNMVVSRWGEAVHVVAPPASVPLSVILKSTTTTTQPVVV